jgi:hypothetical protein
MWGMPTWEELQQFYQAVKPYYWVPLIVIVIEILATVIIKNNNRKKRAVKRQKEIPLTAHLSFILISIFLTMPIVWIDKYRAYEKLREDSKTQTDKTEKTITELVTDNKRKDERLEDLLALFIPPKGKNVKSKKNSLCFNESIKFTQKDVRIEGPFYYSKEITLREDETIEGASRIRTHANKPFLLQNAGPDLTIEKETVKYFSSPDEEYNYLEFTIRDPITNGSGYLLYADHPFTVLCIDRKVL